MIVYENTIGEFTKQCKLDKIGSIIKHDVQLKGFGVGTNEFNSWTKSLPMMATVLDDNTIDKSINVAIEYKFRFNKNRVDFLIYGKDANDKENIVIIELKQWSSSIRPANKPNYVHTIGGGGQESDYFHPSYQAYRYESILKSFNSYIQDNNVTVNSCSYLHNMDHEWEEVLDNTEKFPYVEYSPVFLSGDIEKLRSFIKKYVSKPYKHLLYVIDGSQVRPSKDFSKLMYEALEGNPVFTLDDEQANSVNTIIYETNHALEHNKRATIIIKGGPGSGKSIVAINALGQLIHPKDGSDPKNAVYCTTNFTPRTLFSEMLIQDNYKNGAIKEIFKSLAPFSRASEFDYDCILLDEAHRAYQWKFGQGVKKSVDMIDKLFYASRVNVFFIDEDQIVTKDDYLTIETIKEYAKKYHSDVIEDEELHLSSQFRCMGGDNYISFVNTLLGYDNKHPKYCRDNKYEFKVFDTPSQLWEAIKEKQKQYPLSRLLAGYTHTWISKNDDTQYDFVLDNGNFKMKWNKLVSWSYINDSEQLDRIGCIHTIQGVDMHYAGVIIGKDIIFRNGKIQYDKSMNAKTDTASGIRKANDELATMMIRNTYKVLLTRAIYGTYVYCEDMELNNYIKSSLNSGLADKAKTV